MVFLSITVDDKSKYFEITQAGNTVTMKDGEVFGSVETQTQEFASEQDAKDFIDKTVAEKMSAGYTDDDTVFSMSSLKRPSNSTASAAKPSANVVTAATLKKFLEKYTEIFEEIEGIDELELDIINSSEYFLEYIEDSDFIGYDFSRYPTHKLMDGGSGDFFSGIIDLNKTATGIASGIVRGLDECPIYIFNLDNPDEVPRPAGNFKEYISTLLNAYIDFEEVENIKLARKALKELQSFSSEKYDIDVPMSTELFARKES